MYNYKAFQNIKPHKILTLNILEILKLKGVLGDFSLKKKKTSLNTNTSSLLAFIGLQEDELVLKGSWVTSDRTSH